MDFEAFFKSELDGLHEEGRYRVFADLERQRGNFPRATRYTENGQHDVTVWCSNDYLGMGQNEQVVEAMKTPSITVARVLEAPAIFPAPITIMFCWSRNWPTCMARNRR